VELRPPKDHAASLGGLKGASGACGDHRSFLLSKSREQVQDERVYIGTKLCHEEWDTVRHETRDEVNVSAQPIQFRDRDGALELAGLSKCGGQLGATVQRIGALASLDFDELTDNLETLSLGEAHQRLPLRFNTEPGSPLLRRAHPDVRHQPPVAAR
jgi:hypothetical protein